VWRVLADDTRPWESIPLVKLAGLVLGAALIVFAIRSMFGKKK